MLASGSGKAGAGCPTCSMEALSNDVAFSLAHFHDAQAAARARCAIFHAAPLAARAAARARRVSALRRSAFAKRNLRPRSIARRAIAPRAPRARRLDARARSVFGLATEATSAPKMDAPRAGHQSFFAVRRRAAHALRLHPPCAHRRRDGELRRARRGRGTACRLLRRVPAARPRAPSLADLAAK